MKPRVRCLGGVYPPPARSAKALMSHVQIDAARLDRRNICAYNKCMEISFDDNPEWTEADLAAAKPASKVHPPHVVAALVKRPRGRPAGSDKDRIAIRVDRDVLDRFKAGGPGWQSRINDALRRAVGL